MKRNLMVFITAIVISLGTAVIGFADVTFSSCWVQKADGTWQALDNQNEVITNAWFCDDAIEANGRNVWYLLDADGNMVSAALVQDGTGNYYSLETNHNGYYGMLRYKSGTYDGIKLDLESEHNGSFAAIKNQDGIDKLMEKYGLEVVSIDNSNIVYSSEVIRTRLASNGWVEYKSGKKYYYKNGVALKGWQSIGGKYYYFDTVTGALYTRRYTPDGYYVDAEGVWVEGKKASTTAAAATAATETETVAAAASDDTELVINNADLDPELFDTTTGDALDLWDAASLKTIKTYNNKAITSVDAALAYVAEAKALTDRSAAVKKYYKAFGKATEAINYIIAMEDICADRPNVESSNGTALRSICYSAENLLKDLEDVEIDSTVDLSSAEFQANITKINQAKTKLTEALTVINGIKEVSTGR